MRKMCPLAADHPAVGDEANPCAACRETLREGDMVTLVAVGPGTDPSQQEKARRGQHYTAVCVIAHWLALPAR